MLLQADMFRPPMNHAKMLALCLWQSVYILFALLAAVLARLVAHHLPYFPAMGVGALFVLTQLPFAARRIGLGRASLLASSAAPVFASVAYTMLSVQPFHEQLTGAEISSVGDGLLVLAMSVAVLLVAIAVVPFVPSRWLLRLARTLGVTALAGLAFACALSLDKAARHPAPDAYGALLAEAQCMPVLRMTAGRDPSAPPGATKTIGGARVTYHADGARDACDLRVDFDGGPGELIPYEESPVELSSGYEQATSYRACPAVCVSRTSDDEWVVVEQGEQWARSARVFSGRPFVGNDLTAIGFARVLGPPRPWIAAALFGLVLGLALALRRDRALEAKLGWVETERGGEVVLVSPLARHGSYRGSPDLVDPLFVERGTHAAIEEQVARRKIARWSLAIAMAALFGAPLAVALVVGLAR